MKMVGNGKNVRYSRTTGAAERRTRLVFDEFW